jgi:hypothetical protein
MQQLHINVIKDKLASGELVLLHPKTLQPGMARFANTKTGEHEHYHVIQFSSYKPNKSK